MKEDEMGDEIRKKRLKKVKYEQRKQRVSLYDFNNYHGFLCNV